MKTLKFDDLKGITGFLNGEPELHDEEQKIYDYIKSLGKKVLAIDNLFKFPEKLLIIKKCDNLVLSTTGMHAELINPLVARFEKEKYAPKLVMFMGENTALAFCDIARELKKKYKTEFYFPSIIFKELTEIVWI